VVKVKQRVHREWFRPVSRGGRKSCPSCHERLLPGEYIWSLGNYVRAKWRSVKDVCKACWPKVREELLQHEAACPANCTIELRGRGANLPAWMHLRRQIVPTDVTEIVAAIDWPAADWAGQCYGAAKAIRDAYRMDARLCYGHYTGPVSPDGHFGAHAKRLFQRHGWLELWDGRVYDPTRWAFEGAEPRIYVAENDGEYDLGGQKFMAEIHMLCEPVPPEDDADNFRHYLKVDTANANALLESWFGHSNWVNRAQLFWLAHVPLPMLQEHEADVPIYRAIVAAGDGAVLPIDQRRYVLGEDLGESQS
jgi:hypothetical protein